MKLLLTDREGQRVEPLLEGSAVFVSSPFPFYDRDRQHSAFSAAALVCSYLLRRGSRPVSGVVSLKVMQAAGRLDHTLPGWREYNETLIKACDMTIVAAVPGWAACPLVAADIAAASRKKHPRVYLARLKED